MPPVITHRNRTVRVDQTQLIENALAKSTLSADSAAASSTLTLLNTDKFAVGKYVWINPFSERSELIAVHASTAPVQATGVLTLAANTVFAHTTGEPIYYLEFNQVEVSNAATVAGSKSVLTTAALEPGNTQFTYLDTANTTGFYFARFKDSVAGTFGSYSDGITYGGWPRNSVGFMIDRSLADLGIKLTDLVTTLDCYEWLNAGLKLIQGKLKRWPEHYSYNAILGQVQRGTNVLAMPTDAYDLETNKSIIGFRIGTDKNLTYLDPKTFDAQLDQVAVTAVTTQASVGATSLAINNSYDFADSGTVHVYISNVLYSLTYTGVTRSSTAGFLTGIPASSTGSITVIIPAATYVWQNETEGTPTYFTVRNSQLEWWPLADASKDNANAYGDYSHVATVVDSESDTIDYQRYDMLQDYLTWRMECKAKKNGRLDMGLNVAGKFLPTGYYAQFKERLTDAIKTLPNNNLFKMSPKINSMTQRRGTGTTLQDLNISQQ